MMTEENENTLPRSNSTSSADSIAPSESHTNDTIALLVNGANIHKSDTNNNTRNDTSPFLRRRSSVSIIQTLVNTSHLLTTNDARKRNFLVGTARQSSANDINSYFPDGRLLTVMVATWNTGEASQLYEQNYTPTARQTAQPKERMLDDMSDILLPTFIDYVSDLIIICTQEMSMSKKKHDWEILLQEVIGPTHVLFHSVHFGTLSLCIFLRRDLIWFCTEPEEDIIKFRAVGPLRTKGSLIITFNLFGTSFMVINSHFEAGQGPENRLSRRSNFYNTATKLTIPREYARRTGKKNGNTSISALPTISQRLEASSSIESEPSPSVVKNDVQTHMSKFDAIPNLDIMKLCDCVLWAGDMNFRIDMAYGDAVKCCKEQDFRELLSKDEFYMMQQKTDDLYANFKEANIGFAPTYKFDLRFDEDIYAQHRIPSYTDRILYRDKPTSLIQCTQYKSVEGVKHSDHKPVIAHFRVKLKPGLHQGNLSYGRFNYDVYKRGCKQRERHHSLGVGLRHNPKRRTAIPKSSVCVVQ